MIIKAMENARAVLEAAGSSLSLVGDLDCIVYESLAYQKSHMT